MISNDEDRLTNLLAESYLRAEEAFLQQNPSTVQPYIQAAFDAVFSSQTQAYREVLLGCLLVRISDKSKDIHLPYVKMGQNAFSGRSLDENVVNPFLREKKIPCSRGPYLSVFRRQVRFDETTSEGLRDQKGYTSFLAIINYADAEVSQNVLLSVLDYAMHRFILLRESAKIELIRLERVSFSQYNRLISQLLARPSGGVFPVVLVLAMVEAIIVRFSLNWQVKFQGINVSDKAAGVGGDITLQESGKNILTVEVTERSVDARRVVATFMDKIAPLKLSDYVFIVHLGQIGEHAKQQAEKYFTQGYDVSFVDLQDWLSNSLVIIGTNGRHLFQERVVYHLSGEQIPKMLKVAWNEEITRVIE